MKGRVEEAFYQFGGQFASTAVAQDYPVVMEQGQGAVEPGPVDRLVAIAVFHAHEMSLP